MSLNETYVLQTYLPKKTKVLVWVIFKAFSGHWAYTWILLAILACLKECQALKLYMIGSILGPIIA